MAATDFIAGMVQRLQNFRTEAPALFENLIDQSSIGRCVRRQVGEVRLRIEKLVQHKLQVTQRGMVLRHRGRS